MKVLEDIRKVIKEIKIDYFADENNFIPKIASDKI